MPKTVPQLPGIPKSDYPFSQVVEANGFVFLAGQVGNAPGGHSAAPGGIEAETRAMLDNVGRLLNASGLGFEDVVKCTVYLLDFSEFAAMNAVYREYFPSEPPTRATVGVTALAADYRIEIEVLAASDANAAHRGDRTRASAVRCGALLRYDEVVDGDHRVALRADDDDRERVLPGRLPAGPEEGRPCVEGAAVRVHGLHVRAVDVDLRLAACRAGRAVPRDLATAERERRAGPGRLRVGDRVAAVSAVPGAPPGPGVGDRLGPFTGGPARFRLGRRVLAATASVDSA